MAACWLSCSFQTNSQKSAQSTGAGAFREAKKTAATASRPGGRRWTRVAERARATPLKLQLRSTDSGSDLLCSLGMFSPKWTKNALANWIFVVECALKEGWGGGGGPLQMWQFQEPKVHIKHSAETETLSILCSSLQTERHLDAWVLLPGNEQSCKYVTQR